MTKKNGKAKLIIAIVAIAITLASVTMSIVKSHFSLPIEQAHQKEVFLKMEKENKSEHNQFKANDKVFSENMIELKTDVKYMRADMVEQKALSKEILREIRK